MIFILFWLILVYCPIAHWMWNVDGWGYKMGILDFAGGNVVHVSSGFSGLATAVFYNTKLRLRNKYRENKGL